MKRFFLIALIAGLMASCGADSADQNSSGLATAAQPGALTTIQWLDSAKNLGKINEGQQLQISFRFKNSGDKPLVIQSVRPACGCTVADFPKEPIAPGKEGQITGAFDSKGREGLQHKDIYISANTVGSTEHKVSFEVEVLKKEGTNPVQ